MVSILEENYMKRVKYATTLNLEQIIFPSYLCSYKMSLINKSKELIQGRFLHFIDQGRGLSL